MGGVLDMKLVFISSLILCCSSIQFNNETDKLALLAIKSQIQHDPNGVTHSWNESLHFCFWVGITCSRRHPQRVTTLKLNSLDLVGSLSPHVGNLSFLRVLNLNNNSFTHPIPPQIGHLHRLQVLSLFNNSFLGTIPSNVSNCFKLTYLDLSRNSLVGELPSQLGSLSKLEIFYMDVNNVTGEIPPSLGNLSSLKEFSTIFCNLQGSIPSSLCQLRNLTFFSCVGNRLSGVIPSCISNLSNLVSFGLTDNQIQGSLPPNFFNAFPKLQRFSIDSNLFTGPIPSSLSNATNLMWFQCSSNKFTGQVPNLQNLGNLQVFNIAINNLGNGKQGDLSFLSELVNATRLRVLIFDGNNFGGTLPTSIFNLSTNLQRMEFKGSHLHGSIPAGLGNLVNLQVLSMGGNSLTGSIPTDVGKISGLIYLFLGNNQLSGKIPSSLGNLSHLIALELHENKLEGGIPAILGNCQGLQELNLFGNNLNGTIPQEIFGLSSLTILLAVGRNQFTGFLPMEIGKLENLGVLDVSYNMFSGQLPSSLGSCGSLEGLYLQENLFIGSIPSSMKELRGIRNLDLSRNNFSGGIPQFFEGLGQLENLNLSFNHLSGAIPSGGIFRNASAISVIGNAGLCGGIAIFQLPACRIKGGGLSGRMKLLIYLVSGFTLFGVVAVLSFFFVCKRKKIGLSTLGDSFSQISYAAILKATDGFSSANLLGVGGSGSVYKGVLVENGVIVAVKVFNMLHRRATKSFISECEALRNIRHRNLVKILTACSSIDFRGNNFKALVYEFMENGSLGDWLHPSTRNEEVTEASKSLNFVQRLDIAIDIACALDYLHNHCGASIVHCDLKPSNVLLDKDLTGHVSDFGLARHLSEPSNASRNISSSIGFVGSVGYAAPEYGMGRKVSTYGDVYSFGILLLEMFTGKSPTDEMFGGHLSLHNYVKTALPERVSEILESLDLREDTTNVVKAQMSIKTQTLEECLTSILGIGIACSIESPKNRMDISDVASELQSIRRKVLG